MNHQSVGASVVFLCKGYNMFNNLKKSDRTVIVGKLIDICKKCLFLVLFEQVVAFGAELHPVFYPQVALEYHGGSPEIIVFPDFQSKFEGSIGSFGILNFAKIFDIQVNRIPLILESFAGRNEFVGEGNLSGGFQRQEIAKINSKQRSDNSEYSCVNNINGWNAHHILAGFLSGTTGIIIGLLLGYIMILFLENRKGFQWSFLGLIESRDVKWYGWKYALSKIRPNLSFYWSQCLSYCHLSKI
jgi:hypothetical protein